MPDILNFYMDESGARKPDRDPAAFVLGKPNAFAFGGVLVRDQDEAEVRAVHQAFTKRWKITYPLHSVEIRNAFRNFGWLRRDAAEFGPFMDDLTTTMCRIPVLGIACVIDRPGYDARYREAYGRQQWRLCRTAFSIAVERACKFAIRAGARLRIFPERSSEKDDDRLRRYYDELRSSGMPFDGERSATYTPLGAAELQATLYDFKMKKKTSPMAQIADMYLWPLLMWRYNATYRPYVELKGAGRVIECAIGPEEVGERGCKYSCFDLVDGATEAGGDPRNVKGPDLSI